MGQIPQEFLHLPDGHSSFQQKTTVWTCGDLRGWNHSQYYIHSELFKRHVRKSLLEFNEFLQHLQLLEYSLVSLVVFSVHKDSHKACLFSSGTTFILDMMIDWAFILVWPVFVIKTCYIWLPVECFQHLRAIEIVASMVTAQSSMGSSSDRSRSVVPTQPRLII